VEKESGYKREEILKWSVYEYDYYTVYLAHHAKAVKKYQDIVSKPKK
jgi:hypothetical protein